MKWMLVIFTVYANPADGTSVYVSDQLWQEQNECQSGAERLSASIKADAKPDRPVEQVYGNCTRLYDWQAKGIAMQFY